MQKLFLSDRFFLLSVVITVISTVFYTVFCLAVWPEYSYMAAVVITNGISVIGMYISYRNHSKNVMKGLIGFLLSGLLSVTLIATFPLEHANTIYNTLSLINVAIVSTLCINHFIINSDHHSRSANVKLNQILLFVQFILFIAMAYIWIDGVSGIYYIMYMCGIPMAAFGVTSSIVCVETRLDEFRLDREAAGWTEEKGYPKGKK